MNLWAVAARGFLFALVTGCGSDESGAPEGPISTGTPYEPVVLDIECPTLPPDPDRVRVMVVDTGFDPRHPIFANKIAGCYKVTCPETASEFETAESDDEAAARYVEELSAPADCEVTTGVTLRIDSFLEHYNPSLRTEWNEALFEKRGLYADTRIDIDELFSVVGGGGPQGPLGDTESLFVYHGTATAGVIAYDSDVELVLVERKLGDPGALAESVECVQPDDLALETRLLQREDVRDAYVHTPLSGMDRALRDLRREHGIRIENHSFGVPATSAYESILSLVDCPQVELEEYMGILGELDHERDSYLRDAGEFTDAEPLIFQAAGNDGLRIDEPAEALDCTAGRVDRLLVGSYGVHRGRSSVSFFSNYGSCVDLFAFGEVVIAPAPNGFYRPVLGTSIAAPLATRYAASRLAGTGMSTGALREDVLSVRDELTYLPTSTMPMELGFYTLDEISRLAAPLRHGRLSQLGVPARR